MVDAAEKLPMSMDEFLAWEQEQPTRHEFLGGEIIAMTGASDRHNTIAINLTLQLRDRLRGGPCRVFMSDIKVEVEAADAFFYPDLLVTCSEQDAASPLVKREPTLIVEVLSPSTASYDLGQKFAHYRQLPSLQEYVLVDPDRPFIELFRRSGADQWQLIQACGLESELELTSLALALPMAPIYHDLP